MNKIYQTTAEISALYAKLRFAASLSNGHVINHGADSLET
jgi:hypothetical protein